MAVFSCPSCKKNLNFIPRDETFTLCRHCGSKIIVPSVTVHQAAIENVATNAAEAARLREQRLYEIQSTLNSGRKIEAITMFREAFGAGLAEAKTAVEKLESGVHLSLDAKPLATLDGSVENRVYSGAQTEQPSAAKWVSIIFWLIVTMGILIATVVFRSN
jgi:ribosomal protein L7/L12